MASYAEQVVADGAVAYWRLNETGGTQAADAIGTAHGTISGGVTLGQSGAMPDGTAMTFNGTTGVIAGPSISLPLTFTVELWVNVTRIRQQPAFCNRVPGQYGGIYFGTTGIGGGVNIGAFFYSEVGPNLAGSRPLLDGKWHYLVGACDTTTMYLYVDGVAEGQAALTRPTLTGAWQIAKDPITSDFFDGQIDDVAVYPTALAPAQIVAHYASATGTFRNWTAGWQFLRGKAS